MNFRSIKNMKWNFGNMYKIAAGNIKKIETKKPKPRNRFYFQGRESSNINQPKVREGRESSNINQPKVRESPSAF